MRAKVIEKRLIQKKSNHSLLDIARICFHREIRYSTYPENHQNCWMLRTSKHHSQFYGYRLCSPNLKLLPTLTVQSGCFLTVLWTENIFVIAKFINQGAIIFNGEWVCGMFMKKNGSVFRTPKYFEQNFQTLIFG